MDINLPRVEHTPKKNLSTYSDNSTSRLFEARAGTATQQRPEAAKMLKSEIKNTLIFDGENEIFEIFEPLFHTMIKMQPEMKEAIKTNHFHAHLRKEALQTIRNNGASNKKLLMTC